MRYSLFASHYIEQFTDFNAREVGIRMRLCQPIQVIGYQEIEPSTVLYCCHVIASILA